MKLTQDQFLRGLATTEAFNFDWAWGRDGQHVGLPAGDRDEWSERDREYVEAVEAAQDRAAEAMEEARDCYREGDLDGTLSALQEAASAEREFGDDCTYKLLVGYVADLINARDA